jgi:hypothetical protein
VKTAIENNDLSHEWYVVEIDGKFGSRYGVYIEALKAGMELKQKFPLSLIKIQDADETSVHPNSVETEAERSDLQAAAQTVGQQLIIVDVSSDRDIDTAFATFIKRGAGALLVGSARARQLLSPWVRASATARVASELARWR